jgi:hypothetical protein
MNRILQKGKMRVENQTKLKSEKPRKIIKNMKKKKVNSPSASLVCGKNFST